MPNLENKIEIAISDIERVESRPWFHRIWGGFPGFPVFRISTREGKRFSFQTPGAGRWLVEIPPLKAAPDRGEE
jgi:hypothetical protein